MTFETIIYNKEAGIGRITLNRPQAMNAITPFLLSEVTIAMVEAGVTLGEICGVLRQVWGEYQPPAWA